MKNVKVFLAVAAFLFLSFTLIGQSRLSLELRGDVGFPTQKLGGADLKTGFGFEGTISYRFLPNVSAYAGWGWHKFQADQSFAGNDMDFEETGYALGLQFMHPIGELPLGYFVNGGILYNHLETENQEGEIIDDSGHGIGWQAGAGLSVSISERLNILPGVRFRALSRDLEVGNISRAVNLTYLTGSVSLMWAF